MSITMMNFFHCFESCSLIVATSCIIRVFHLAIELSTLLIAMIFWNLKEEEEDCARDITSLDRIQIPPSLSLLTAQQALELMLVLSQIDPTKNTITNEKTDSATKDLETTASTTNDAEVAVPEVIGSVAREQHEQISGTTQNIPEDIAKESGNSAQAEGVVSRRDDEDTNVAKITDEICQDKLDQLKVLLDDARKAVTNIVSSHEKLCSTNKIEPEANKPEVDPVDRQEVRVDPEVHDTLSTTPSVSRSNSESDCRAGRYNKKPAPRAPLSKLQDDLDEESATESALKATLVIKTGTLKTFTNVSQTKNVFVSHPPDSSRSRKKKSRRKEGFTKLLTIPKTFFNNAFHKEQRDALSSDQDSETGASRSRSVSVGSAGNSSINPVVANDQPADATPQACTDISAGNSTTPSVALNSTIEEPKKTVAESVEEKGEARPSLRIRQMSHSPTRRPFQDSE